MQLQRLAVGGWRFEVAERKGSELLKGWRWQNMGGRSMHARRASRYRFQSGEVCLLMAGPAHGLLYAHPGSPRIAHQDAVPAGGAQPVTRAPTCLTPCPLHPAFHVGQHNTPPLYSLSYSPPYRLAYPAQSTRMQSPLVVPRAKCSRVAPVAGSEGSISRSAAAGIRQGPSTWARDTHCSRTRCVQAAWRGVRAGTGLGLGGGRKSVMAGAVHVRQGHALLPHEMGVGGMEDGRGRAGC